MNPPAAGTLWIGTSNVVIPGNKSTFPGEYQGKSRLNYYSSLFNSVELNSTFYKLPMAATFEKWSKEVGDGFRLSVKLWKEITHAKDLAFNEADVKRFMGNAHFLQDKKGCLLLQFPGKITLDYFEQVEQVLKTISLAPFSNEWPKVVEFRHASWHTGETRELLDEYQASIVLHDFPKGKTEEVNKKAKVIYTRFHGPTGDYRWSYNEAFLKQKAAQIKVWLGEGKEVYAYFNNTIGEAYGNAIRLRELLG